MRLQAEKALLKEKREKELILENLSEQVSYMDTDMRLVWVNSYVCERHELKRDDYLGRKCHELFHGFIEPCPGCPVPSALETGRVATGMTVSPDGLFWNLTITPVYAEGEEVIGVLHFTYDVTDLKVSEVELKKLNQELEKRVEERTAELKNLINELNAFTYSVSHDLRSLLRSIKGFCEVIREDHSHNLNDEGNRYLERVYAASHKMSSLIDDLLKLSQISRHEIHRRKVNLSSLVETYIKELKEKEPQREVKVVIERDLSVSGDRALLDIALGNLLDNAWKFTGAEEKACIEFGSFPSGKDRIYYIRDNGIGFDMTYSDKLFTAFQRLHSHGQYPGPGIGLSIVARIINRHGGEVWAEGEPGRGATFYFKLPPI